MEQSNRSCGTLLKLGCLRPGIQAGPCVAVLLGFERPREIVLKCGDKALRASLFLADDTRPLGVELAVWGANALRLAYLRPLVLVHVPGVSQRVSQYGVESLTTAAPQHIVTLDESRCNCRTTQIATDARSWNRLRHGALDGVVVRASSTVPTGLPSRPLGEQREETKPTPVDAVRWVRGKVRGVRMRSKHEDVSTALQAGVTKRCTGCHLTNASCSCANGTGIEHILDEDKVAVRVEFGDDIVTHCAGSDLARLLFVQPHDLLELETAKRAAHTLQALAADTGVFDIAIQHIPGEPVPRLVGLRF